MTQVIETRDGAGRECVGSDVPAFHPRGKTVLRAGPASVLVSRRGLVVGAALTLLVAALAVGLLYIHTLPADTVTSVLLGGGRPLPRQAILNGQLPIVITGLVSGAGLAAAGALTQTVTRNPLASPDLLGITSGASTAAVLGLAFGSSWGAWFADIGTQAAALLGAFVAAAVMFVLSWKGGLDTFRLVLVGVSVTWLCTAATSYLLTRTEVLGAEAAQRWLAGSISSATWSSVIPLLVIVPIGLIAAMTLARRLAAVSLGEDVAAAIGVSAVSAAAWSMLVAVVLAGIVVSGAGPIGFVALLAPQIAKRLIRSAVPGPLTSALTGALMVLLAELVCRLLLPAGIPVGIVTAGIGGPFLIYMMVSVHRRGMR